MLGEDEVLAWFQEKRNRHFHRTIGGLKLLVCPKSRQAGRLLTTPIERWMSGRSILCEHCDTRVGNAIPIVGWERKLSEVRS